MITLFILFCLLVALVVTVLAGLIYVLWPVLAIIFGIWLIVTAARWWL